jgi:Ca-activated chloride channel homolog
VCPLKHTDVKAEISGFLARVVVTQEFQNPFKSKIEAVYAFPLPQNAAVDNLTMRVGERTVRGRIKRREEAREIYEAARDAGNVASLLDQERPNIFTQSVANIMPGEKVTVIVSYVETLKYDAGSYEFVFPMVVGPRYIPGVATGRQGGGWSPDTSSVPDGSRVTPPVAALGTRAGHDISIEIALDPGVPIDGLKSTLHEVDIERPTSHSAVVSLKNKARVPNKDFILRYDVSGGRIEDAFLTHRSDSGGFFTFILQPPERVTIEDVTPKELIFVLDTSGSMSGFPIEKAKETMKLALDGLYERDTFNLITFSGNTSILFPEPVLATAENLHKAQAFLDSRSGGGGTEMMSAVRAALDPSDSQNHIRIVCFMTDGYVGNDMEIISEVQKHPNARVFSFGIGGSVNRFLLDKIAEKGRGEVEYVALSDDGSAAAKRFHERIRNPLLTDVTVDWSGLTVADVYPKRIPDLFSAKPVVLCGRYEGAGNGIIKLQGKVSGRDFTREIPVSLPESEPRRDVLATLWARTRIDDLMGEDYQGIQSGRPRAEVMEAITSLGLEFGLMTQFTSFVAVEEMIVTDGGQPRKIEVPVDIPEGVSHQGVFGRLEMSVQTRSGTRISRPKMRRTSGGGIGVATGGGVGPGDGRGVSAGTGYNIGGASPPRAGSAGQTVPKALSPASPAPPPASRTNPNLAPFERLRLNSEVERLSAQEQKRRELLSKLHPSLAAVVERLSKKGSPPGSAEAEFVHNGKAEVQVWFNGTSRAAIAQLQRLGFDVILMPKTAKMVIGRISIDKLQALAGLNAVRYVAPMK